VVQIGCRCPLDKQDVFLEPVRGRLGAGGVPADRLAGASTSLGL
jgi:hypothetical protein